MNNYILILLMGANTRLTRSIWLVISLLLLLPVGVQAAPPRVDVYRMRMPHDAGDINQASDLCWGALGDRAGLWTCCDRNGLDTAGKIYRFSPETLQKAGGGKIAADEEFTITRPDDWEAFAREHRNLGGDRLDDIRRRLVADSDRADEPYLDLEAITIAPGIAGPHAPHLFVVSEEPFSTVMELSPGPADSGVARLTGAYAYHELASEQGSAHNDGLEGFAWVNPRAGAGSAAESSAPRFYFAEEGTRPAENARDDRLLFLDPRLGVAELRDDDVQPLPEISTALTTEIRKLRSGPSQTLNAICPLKDGTILLVDRNGGLILRADPNTRKATRYLNLYDLDGLDLRNVLAETPHPRQMPYVSIEGIALDDAGDLWLVDDPAMPEGFRESTLLRIRLSTWTSRPAN